MDKTLEEQIINLYLQGIGSTTISKKLSIDKRKVLKLLKSKNLTRTDKLPKQFYENFWEENGKWFGYWVCQTCKEDILFSVNKKYLLNRNLKNKKVCKKCSLLKQRGDQNPFFGKKHKPETIEKISQKKIGISTSDHMSKPEYKKLISDLAKKRWSSGIMEKTRIKLSKMMKERISNGEFKGYNRSKAEDEIIKKLTELNIETKPNFILEGKIFDIYLPKFNLIIEYNGDYWHCNPNKFKPDYFNHKKNKTAKEIWEYDKNKIDLAIKNDYIVEIIWESDYKKNKITLIDKILNKWREKI